MKDPASLANGTMALPMPHTTCQQSRGAAPVAAPDFNFLSETIMVQTSGVIHHHRAMHPHEPATLPAKPGGTGIPLAPHHAHTHLQAKGRAECERHRILHSNCYGSDMPDFPRCSISEAVMDDDKREVRHPLQCRLAHIYKPVESKPAASHVTIDEVNNENAGMLLTMGIDPSKPVENTGGKIFAPPRRPVANAHPEFLHGLFDDPKVAVAEQQEPGGLMATYNQTASAASVEIERAARGGAGSAAIADLELKIPAAEKINDMLFQPTLLSKHVPDAAPYFRDPETLKQIWTNIAAMKKTGRLPSRYEPQLGAMAPVNTLIKT